MRPIAINLPQYHEMELNNEWWGKGFTDWDKVRTAIPLYEGHLQPKVPLNEFYYDMTKKKTIEYQTNLMKEYSVYGMAYYHYWYNNKPLMDTPLETLYSNKDIDQKYLFFWSNCDWYYSQPGTHRRLMMLRQEYGDIQDWKLHIDYLLRFFSDERYITYDGKPVLIIYRPGEIPNFDEMISFFKETCIKAGLNGLYVIENLFNFGEEAYSNNTDAVMYREPNSSKKLAKKSVKFSSSLNDENGISCSGVDVFQYKEIVEISLKKQKQYHNIRKQFFSAFPFWDNTPRHKYNGFVVENSSPEIFGYYLSEIEKNLMDKSDFVFINAWNEWAEGMYLEPDERYNYDYLEALKKAVGGTEYVLCETDDDYFSKLIQMINEAERVFIYGAGVYGIEVKEFIDTHCSSNKLCAFIDDTESKIDTVFMGLRVISGELFAKNPTNALVLVCCDERNHQIMIDKLLRIGVSEEKIVIPRIAFMNPEKDSQFIHKNKNRLIALSEILADDRSRQVLWNTIEYRLTHDQNLLDQIADPVSLRYFDNNVLNGLGKGFFIDCGTYLGDSLDGYVNYAGTDFTGGICCEASQTNIVKLAEHIQGKNYQNVQIVNRAIWKSEGMVKFFPAGEKSGYVSDDGTIEIQSVTIDSIAFDKPTDFLKIEVNGAEYEALLGATDTVISKFPVIAISVYHNIEDIIRIPFFIGGLRTDYEIYLRFYGLTTLTDIVCYAVPVERKNQEKVCPQNMN